MSISFSQQVSNPYVRVDKEHVRVNEALRFDCHDSKGTLVLRKGLVVTSPRQLEYLIDRGLFASLPPRGMAMEKHGAPKSRTPFELLNDYSNRLKHVYADLQEGLSSSPERLSFTDRILSLANDIQHLCALDLDAVLGAIHLDSVGRCTVALPLYRAIICELLGRRQHLSETDKRLCVAAALTCDLSILELQRSLANHTSVILAEHQGAIRLHPVLTAKLLRRLGVSDEAWVDAVSQHHELPNGRGYPNSLAGDEISLLARIVGMAGLYASITTPRAYRKPMLTGPEMRAVFRKRGAQVDPDLVSLLEAELGMYPPGTVVKLQNGETAIVVRRTSDKDAPLVKSVAGSRGLPYDAPITRNSIDEEFAINVVVTRALAGRFSVHHLWGYASDLDA